MSHVRKLVFAIAPILVCCAQRETSDAVTGNTNAQPPDRSHENAIWILANARCDNAALCDNIGEGKAYASRNACLDHERAQSYEKSCIDEIERGSRKCADDIRAGRCPQRGY